MIDLLLAISLAVATAIGAFVGICIGGLLLRYISNWVADTKLTYRQSFYAFLPIGLFNVLTSAVIWMGAYSIPVRTFWTVIFLMGMFNLSITSVILTVILKVRFSKALATRLVIAFWTDFVALSVFCLIVFIGDLSNEAYSTKKVYEVPIAPSTDFDREQEWLSDLESIDIGEADGGLGGPSGFPSTPNANPLPHLTPPDPNEEKSLDDLLDGIQ